VETAFTERFAILCTVLPPREVHAVGDVVTLAQQQHHHIGHMADMRSAVLEDRNGAVYWPGVLQAASSKTYLSAELVQTLKDRLKSEQTHIVLNTLTVSTSASHTKFAYQHSCCKIALETDFCSGLDNQHPHLHSFLHLLLSKAYSPQGFTVPRRSSTTSNSTTSSRLRLFHSQEQHWTHVVGYLHTLHVSSTIHQPAQQHAQ
jgi:hypothetical protein